METKNSKSLKPSLETLPSPAPLSLPLPVGVDVLRPNQDIQIHFWQPRPIYMQLNDELDVNSLDSEALAVYAPAFVNVFDEASGNFIESRRAKLEVGFTDPVELGPWSAMTLRFRASRSRPPEPEVVPEVLPAEPSEVGPAIYPMPQITQSMRTDQVGSWFAPPLDAKLNELDNYISSQVTDPPGDPAILTTSNPLDWPEGWVEIKVRVRVHAHTSVPEDTGERRVVGMSARQVNWSNTASLSGASDIVWFDDGFPAGAIQLNGTGTTWSWVTGPTPSPFSGTKYLIPPSGSGFFQTYFDTTTDPMVVQTGDILFLYVYVKTPANVSEILVNWYDGTSWDHCAQWGDNSITPSSGDVIFGTTPNLIGAVPSPGVWTRLEVPASTVGLEGATVSGMCVSFNGSGFGVDSVGRATSASSQSYTVTWNPFDSAYNLNAALISEYEVDGSGTISTNIDINATFFISSDADIHLLIDVSLDGVNYDGIVTFDLSAFDTLLVYYRIRLNQGGPTPAGKVAIGAGLQITGPLVTTSMQLVYWDGNVAPVMTLATIDCPTSKVDLTSLVRLKVGLTGNPGFQVESPLYTNILTEDWLSEELVWTGFWDRYNIRDLHVSLTATAIEVSDDAPYIDVDTLEIELTPYCPGVYPPPQDAIPGQSVRLYTWEPPVPPAISHYAVLGWTPEPAYDWLQSRADRVTSDYIVVDPRVLNQLSLDIQDLPALPPPPSGYTRQWTSIQMRVQAQLVCDTNTQCQLGLRTAYGPLLYTDTLIPDPTLYSVQWDYSPGLTDDEMTRLYVEVLINTLTQGESNTSIYLYALEIVATYADVFTGMPPSPPPVSPPVTSPITLIDQQGEVFSCGSLGDCDNPQGKLLGRLTVTNTAPCTVSFATDNMVSLKIFDTGTPTTIYNLTDTLSTPMTRDYSVNAWIGNGNIPNSDPYPVEPRSGDLVITMTQGSSVYQARLPWFYLGL